jgi:nucleoside-diphosphate-sugar epimerase
MATVPHSVLITGGAGFIGEHIHAVLERQGWTVVSLDSAAARLDSGCLRCDITDVGQLEGVFRAHHFERIIHAASILPTAARQDPRKATEVNVGGSLNILEMAARFQANRVIYASSGSVYGTQPASNFVSEDQLAAPEDVYGAAKRYVEILGEAYERRFGVEFVALRIVMVFGPGGTSVTSPWRNQVFEYLGSPESKEVLIPYSPDETLPVVHVEEIASMLATLTAAERCSHHIYNSFGDCVHPSELKKEIESLNPNVRVTLGTAPATGGARAIDSSRFAREFGVLRNGFWQRLRREAQKIRTLA